MTDAKDQLKHFAKLIKQSAPRYQNLSHGQSLELAIALLTESESWNHYCSSPTPITIPEDVQSYFSAAHRFERRLSDLGVLPNSDRAGRTLAGMELLAAMSGKESFEVHIWELLDQAGVSSPVTIIDGDAREVSSRDDGLVSGLLPYRIGTWLFTPPGEKQRWDHTEELALQMGFSKTDAALIRQLQREAPNHGWPIANWFDVGVLDGDQEAFLTSLRDDPDWQANFSELYRTDAGSMP